MSSSQQPFPVRVHTGWVDYSPALRHHASERVRSRLSDLASEIRSVVLRVSDGEPPADARRRCHVEVMTRNAGPISASTVGTDLFNIVDNTVDRVAEMLRSRLGAVPTSDWRLRIA